MATEYLSAAPPVGAAGRFVYVGLGSLAREPPPASVDVALAEFLKTFTGTAVLGHDAVVLLTSDGAAAVPGGGVAQWGHGHVPLLWLLVPGSIVKTNDELKSVVYRNGGEVVSGVNVYSTLVHLALGTTDAAELERGQLMRSSLFFPVRSTEPVCQDPPFARGICPCGWQTCPTGVRHGIDNLESPHRPSGSRDPIVAAFSVHVAAAIASVNSSARDSCRSVGFDDFVMVRCPRPPVFFDPSTMEATFEVEIAHVGTYLFHASGSIKAGVVTLKDVRPAARQGICRAGLNEAAERRANWVVGCFCL